MQPAGNESATATAMSPSPAPMPEVTTTAQFWDALRSAVAEMVGPDKAQQFVAQFAQSCVQHR